MKSKRAKQMKELFLHNIYVFYKTVRERKDIIHSVYKEYL